MEANEAILNYRASSRIMSEAFSAIMMMGRYQLGRALSETQVQDIHAWLRTLTGEIPLAYIAEPRLPANQK